jgi:hypothetical protein
MAPFGAIVTAPMAWGKSSGQVLMRLTPPSTLFHSPAVETAT